MGTVAVEAPPAVGLGNQALLAKIDKLRELNVGAVVPLPQLIVVGDQSSGKSSVLESLTGFSFPSATTLCTRYATQITCIRDAQEKISISIIPRPGADEGTKKRLRQFRRSVDGLGEDELAAIFADANRAMGVRPPPNSRDDEYDDEPPGGFVAFNRALGIRPARNSREDEYDDEPPGGFVTFSEDILKIEISGPDQSHLTVIDVPGIFRAATPGLTTESDIALVRNMVTSYMADSRTIILAVIPCNLDIATQEVLELARAADPNGVRTMGVLTKPDLAVERAVQQNVLDLVLGNRNSLKLGYCVVRNRGADDKDSTLAERHQDEQLFFRRDPWSSLAATRRAGVDALKKRLSDLLLDVSKRELPAVRAEITKRLSENRKLFDGMGEARSDERSQRVFLGRLASRFERTVSYALNAYYTEDKVFEDLGMRLITRIIQLNESFVDHFRDRGHTRNFRKTEGEDPGLTGHGAGLRQIEFALPDGAYPELDGILTDVDMWNYPRVTDDDSILDHIEQVFRDSRGPELGTFGGALLATTFKEQSIKWEDLVLAHVSNAIVVVHDFIARLLEAVVPERQVRDELWDTILLERLQAAYTRAMDHARFLLEVEREGKPITYNGWFARNLDEDRSRRLVEAMRRLAIPSDQPQGFGGPSLVVPLDYVRGASLGRSGVERVREDLHDILKSYYAVSSARFTDVVCQQVVDHCLLSARDSPLAAFSQELVMGLDPGQLDGIAGEDALTRQERQRLGEEIANLAAALRVLRS